MTKIPCRKNFGRQGFFLKFKIKLTRKMPKGTAQKKGAEPISFVIKFVVAKKKDVVDALRNIKQTESDVGNCFVVVFSSEWESLNFK